MKRRVPIQLTGSIVATAIIALASILVLADGRHDPARDRRSTRDRNPLAGARFYVDPRSFAARQIDTWRIDHPDWSDELRAIADEPQVDWFNEDTSTVRDAVERRTAAVRATGALPLFVAYNIPNRDCGSHSSGGRGATATGPGSGSSRRESAGSRPRSSSNRTPSRT